MKKDVTIEINTINSPQGGEEEKSSVTLRGKLYTKDELYIISYKETAEGLGKTLTTLKFKSGRVELLRSGELSSFIVFDKKAPFNGIYPTPYGKFPITVTTNKIEVSAGEDEGRIFLNYVLDLAGEKIKNKFELKYF